MFILKSILGAFIGFGAGIVVGFAAGIGVWIVVGLFAWDSAIGDYWGSKVAVLCFLVGPVIGFAIPIVEEVRRQAKLASEEQEQLTARQLYELRQAEYEAAFLKQRIDRLYRLLSESEIQFRCLQDLVPLAERHLDKAEFEFKERVFAPFWDEVEHATNALATYQNTIAKIEQNAALYRKEARELDTTVPDFSLPLNAMPDGRSSARRLELIVRRAQKDFQFSTIYEQRKTNQVLIAGFGTLASAIFSMGHTITTALDELASSMDISLSALLAATENQTGEIRRMSENVGNAAMEQMRQAAVHAKKRSEHAQEMELGLKNLDEKLDNIQRHRKPRF